MVTGLFSKLRKGKEGAKELAKTGYYRDYYEKNKERLCKRQSERVKYIRENTNPKYL